MDENDKFTNVWFDGEKYDIDTWKEKFTSLDSRKSETNTNADSKNDYFEK